MLKYTDEVKLTYDERIYFDWIKNFFSTRKHFPTLKEMCFEFGWKSLISAQKRMATLVRKGYLEKTGGTRGFKFKQESPIGVPIPVMSFEILEDLAKRGLM